MTCNRDPVGDHGAHRSHTNCKPFSTRAKHICNKSLARVVDQVEVHLQQLQDCIHTCFAEPSTDPRRSMEHMGVLKKEAVRAWEEFLVNDRTRTLPDRPLGSYPVATWALLWPLTKRARGESSCLVGYFRHLESCLHYMSGSCWVPSVMVDRLTHTGHLLLASTLADMRKQSSGANLPKFLEPPRTNESWFLLGYTNTPIDRMFATFGCMTWEGAVSRPQMMLVEDQFADKITGTMQRQEEDILQRQAEGISLSDGTEPEHRLKYKRDNTVRVKTERVWLQGPPPVHRSAQRTTRHDNDRQGRDRSRDRRRDDRQGGDRNRSPRRRSLHRLNPVAEEREEDVRHASQGASSSQPRMLSSERASMEEELAALKAELEAKDMILAEAREDAKTYRQRNDFLLGHKPGDSR